MKIMSSFKKLYIIRFIVMVLLFMFFTLVLFVLSNYNTVFIACSCPLGLLFGFKFGKYIDGFTNIKYLEQSVITRLVDKGIIKIGDKYVCRKDVWFLNKCLSGDKIYYIEFRDIYVIMKDKKGMKVS